VRDEPLIMHLVAEHEPHMMSIDRSAKEEAGDWIHCTVLAL